MTTVDKQSIRSWIFLMAYPLLRRLSPPFGNVHYLLVSARGAILDRPMEYRNDSEITGRRR